MMTLWHGGTALKLVDSFAGFSQAFLARFVKAGDSTKARAESASMQQNGLTVEGFAAKFPNCASRVAAICVDMPVGSTTKAGHCLTGLRLVYVNNLSGVAEPETMHNIGKLTAAAICAEANMNVSGVAQTVNGQHACAASYWTCAGHSCVTPYIMA